MIIVVRFIQKFAQYLGFKHELAVGFSWSLIHQTDPALDSSLSGLPLMAEFNLKLAVILTIMDGYMLPILDQSEINMMHSVHYNCRSNFNQINYSRSYTIILERGNEIISVTSLSFVVLYQQKCPLQEPAIGIK